MRNRTLAADHVRRAEARLKALDTLYEAESWAELLEAERDRLPAALADDIDRLAAASRSLRRDRELPFLGAEGLVPSDFHREPDAEEARMCARFVVDRVQPFSHIES